MQLLKKLWKKLTAGPRLEFGDNTKVRSLMRQHGCSYYFVLTFGGAKRDKAQQYFDHLCSSRNPPARFVAVWGTWLSTDYNNAKCYFAAWLCRDRAASDAIGQWEYRNRPSDFVQGSVSNGSPSSPLGIGCKVEEIIDQTVCDS